MLLLWIAGGMGTALAALVGVVCCCRLPGGAQLASDPEVLALVRQVAPQSMLSQFMCAVALTLEGIAIGSGERARLSPALKQAALKCEGLCCLHACVVAVVWMSLLDYHPSQKLARAHWL